MKEIMNLPRVPAEQLEILRHALGIGQGGCRNHFVTSPDCADYPHCEALVAAGLMKKRPGSALSVWNDVYTTTKIGRAVAHAGD